MHPEKVDSAWRPELSEMVVRLVRSDEQRRYQQLMRAHHYLGYLPKIGETLWYVATWREQWLALLSFSGSAVKGVCPGIGKKLSGTAWCCWKPLSIRSAIAGRCTGRRTGCMWGTREDIAGLTGDTRLRRKLPRWCFSDRCGPMLAKSCAARFSLHPID